MGKKKIKVIDEEEQLQVQAVIVTAGPHKGRIGENDDAEFIVASEFSESEIRQYKRAGVDFGYLGPDDDDFDGEKIGPGTNCEVVYFGTILSALGYHLIPRQALRPANITDLVSRYQAIRGEVSNIVFGREDSDETDHLCSLLAEELYIFGEIWSREKMAMDKRGNGEIVFLCHSSKDKHFVRQIWNDLAAQGYSPWIDEFEINVGDSIVERVNDASMKADAILICISSNSIDADWVKREWQSSLARKLSGGTVKILPALFDNVDLPALLSDIKYADFRNSYRDGLADILRALSKP